MDSDISWISPVGNNVFIIKDEDDSRSQGGVIIPEAHREYKRRGWVLSIGGGLRLKDGFIQRMPYDVGDYLIADRPFVRMHEDEDEVFSDPAILLIRGDEPVAFVRRKDCVGSQRLPEKYLPIIQKFGFNPGRKEQAGAGSTAD